MADIHLQLVTGGNFARRMAMLSDHVKAETRKWLIGTKRKVVGQIKGHIEGKYQKLALGRPSRPGTGPLWEKSARHAFIGHMKEFPLAGHSRLELELGIISRKTYGFMQGLRLMTKGGTISVKSKRWMPVPIYKNVQPYRMSKESHVALFRRLKARKDLTRTAFIKGTPMLLSKSGELLYIGKPMVKLPRKEFKFMSTFYSSWPKELQFGRNRISRAIQAYQKGFAK